MSHNDPVENAVAAGLDAAGIGYVRDKEAYGKSIDFYLPDYDIYIEVCRAYTERKIRQLEPYPEIILIQGLLAARAFSAIISNTPR